MIKVCSKCGEAKSVDDFYLHKGKRTSEGYRNPKCKQCSNAQAILWAKANPDKVKANRRVGRLKLKYKISVKEYDDILLSQGGTCAICNQLQTRDRLMNVDHNHETGKVRGILCDKCNMAVGLFNDNITNIKNALNYLIAHENSIN